MGGFFNPESSELSSGDPKRSKGKENGESRKKVSVPVTIKMIKETKITVTDTLFIDNEEVSNVIVVGRAIRIKRSSLRRDIILNDNTGVVDVIVYIKEDMASTEATRGLSFK